MKEKRIGRSLSPYTYYECVNIIQYIRLILDQKFSLVWAGRKRGISALSRVMHSHYCIVSVSKRHELRFLGLRREVRNKYNFALVINSPDFNLHVRVRSQTKVILSKSISSWDICDARNLCFRFVRLRKLVRWKNWNKKRSDANAMGRANLHYYTVTHAYFYLGPFSHEYSLFMAHLWYMLWNICAIRNWLVER